MSKDRLRYLQSADTMEITVPKTRNRPGVRVDRPFETRRAVGSELKRSSKVEEEEASIEEKILNAMLHFEDILQLIERTPSLKNHSVTTLNGTYRGMFSSLKDAVDARNYAAIKRKIADRVIPILESLVSTFESHKRINGNFAISLEKFEKLKEELETKITFG